MITALSIISFLLSLAGVKPLTAPAFAYCFPLLKIVLTDTVNDSEEKEGMLIQALQMINEHAQLRSMTDGSLLIDEVMVILFHFVF